MNMLELRNGLDIDKFLYLLSEEVPMEHICPCYGFDMVEFETENEVYFDSFFEEMIDYLGFKTIEFNIDHVELGYIDEAGYSKALVLSYRESQNRFDNEFECELIIDFSKPTVIDLKKGDR